MLSKCHGRNPHWAKWKDWLGVRLRHSSGQSEERSAWAGSTRMPQPSQSTLQSDGMSEFPVTRPAFIGSDCAGNEMLYGGKWPIVGALPVWCSQFIILN